MALHRLTRLTVGVPDPDGAAGFYEAFGLRNLGRGRFATRDGGEQLHLVPARWRGVQRIGVGCDDPGDLDRIAATAERAGYTATRSAGEQLHTGRPMPAATGREGAPGERLEVTDPASGVVFEVGVAPRLVPTPHRLPAANTPARTERFDTPADGVLRDRPVEPAALSHLVLGTPDWAATLAFVTDVIGFEVSDSLHGVIAFTRCSESHHNLAVQQAPCRLLHHVAFEVDDVDEVARGGAALTAADAGRHVWGLGRHAIGSNWFWYLRDPAGNYVEYTADLDRITDGDHYRPKDWQGQEWLYAYGPPVPPVFLEPPDVAELLAAQAVGEEVAPPTP